MAIYTVFRVWRHWSRGFQGLNNDRSDVFSFFVAAPIVRKRENVFGYNTMLWESWAAESRVTQSLLDTRHARRVEGDRWVGWSWRLQAILVPRKPGGTNTRMALHTRVACCQTFAYKHSYDVDNMLSHETCEFLLRDFVIVLLTPEESGWESRSSSWEGDIVGP